MEEVADPLLPPSVTPETLASHILTDEEYISNSKCSELHRVVDFNIQKVKWMVSAILH